MAAYNLDGTLNWAEPLDSGGATIFDPTSMAISSQGSLIVAASVGVSGNSNSSASFLLNDGSTVELIPDSWDNILLTLCQ